MNVIVILLAATSVPRGPYGLQTILWDEIVKGLFGTAAAFWSVAGVLGSVFFSGLLAILLARSV